MTIDKFYHFVAGTCVLVLSLIAGLPYAVCALLVLVAALGKEVYDKYVKHSVFDPLDLVATCSPLVALVVRYILL